MSRRQIWVVHGGLLGFEDHFWASVCSQPLDVVVTVAVVICYCYCVCLVAIISSRRLRTTIVGQLYHNLLLAVVVKAVSGQRSFLCVLHRACSCVPLVACFDE